MNVGELLRERDRLLGVMEEAKSARAKLKQVNVLIALYGTAADAAVVSNGSTPEGVACELCDAGPFKGRQGLGLHQRLAHGIASPAKTQAAKKAAKKAAK